MKKEDIIKESKSKFNKAFNEKEGFKDNMVKEPKTKLSKVKVTAYKLDQSGKKGCCVIS